MQRRWHGLWLGLVASSSFGCPDGTKGTYVVDDDGDGFEPPADCDDADPDVNPDAVEVCGDGIDNDCDGIEPACVVDDDGDGWAAQDDCDDTDANVHPDAYESCTDGIDNDCDGISTVCVVPTMTYGPTLTGAVDSYGTAVFADRILFGDPSGGTVGPIGDGRAVFFELIEGVVSELDADFIAPGEVGADGAYGVVIDRVGDRICINADYHDYDANTAEAGKGWCFAEATVRAATTSLDLGQAEFTVAGSAFQAFAKTVAEADVDGDGDEDLVVYSADGLHVIYGDGSPWTGELIVPADADVTLGGDCAASPTYWCGFASSVGGSAIAHSGAGGPTDEIAIYGLPLASQPSPVATYPVDRAPDDSLAYIESIDGFAVGSSTRHRVFFIDGAGNELEVLNHPDGEMFGYWVDTMQDQDGHELLLVGAHEALWDGVPSGAVFVFDLTEHGLPSKSSQAVYRLNAPSGYEHCGLRARGGIVTDEGGVNTVVSASCYGNGGAAWVLDSRPLPPPIPLPADIVQTSATSWKIRREIIDAFSSYLPWALGLAQTEVVTQGESIVGWRLHGIAVGSPLYRAGLRTGDVLRRINGTDVTTPAVVRGLIATLLDGSGATVLLRRNGVNRTHQYTVVD